ncbi:MAG: threonine--tRNA ligase, partial [Candidatus Nanopelagicales bacterium]
MVAAVVNGVNVDLDTELRDGDEVRGVHISSAEGLAILRHSAAHVAAQATQKLIPSAKLGIGPPITDGFYYEFDLPESLKPEDLQEIEKQMVLIIKSRQRFRRRVVTREQALAELADEPYKLRLIGADSSTEVLNPDV